MADEVTINHVEEQGTVVVSLTGRLDSFAAVDAEPALMNVAESARGPVVVDLGGLEYVSSLGLQTLLRFARTLEQRGCPLWLCSPTPFVAQVLDISHFADFFRIRPTREDALKSCTVEGGGA